MNKIFKRIIAVQMAIMLCVSSVYASDVLIETENIETLESEMVEELDKEDVEENLVEDEVANIVDDVDIETTENEDSNSIDEEIIDETTNIEVIDVENLIDRTYTKEDIVDRNKIEEEMIENVKDDESSLEDEETTSQEEIELVQEILLGANPEDSATSSDTTSSSPSNITTKSEATKAQAVIKIQSTYNQYEQYSGENSAVVDIKNNDEKVYSGNSKIEIVKGLKNSNDESPMILEFEEKVDLTSAFDFYKESNNYVLAPAGLVEDVVAKMSGSGYINPQAIRKLDKKNVELYFNDTNLGAYELYEYGLLYYLNCYEGLLGVYYYYNPEDATIDEATTFYINNDLLDRAYSMESEYYYRTFSGKQLSFKPSWVLNEENLKGSEKEKYALQWVNFPYFLIKAGEKYWKIKDSVKDSQYAEEYADNYNAEYEESEGEIDSRILVLDDVYKSEESILERNTNGVSIHPYTKSDKIKISGNLREDTINEKLLTGGVIPFDTNLILNVEVEERKAKSIQVYLNGDKLITNANTGLYALKDGKCRINIESSKLEKKANERNIIGIILLDEAGEYVTDSYGRIINSYISVIKNEDIEKETYLVEFNTNGGNEISSVQVEEGNKLNMPTTPTKRNLTFMGWYNDEKLTEEFDTNEYILENKTLYAKWSIDPNIKPVIKIKSSYADINSCVGSTNVEVIFEGDAEDLYSGEGKINVLYSLTDKMGLKPVEIGTKINTKFEDYNFTKSNDNYVLMPKGYIDSIALNASEYIDIEKIKTLEQKKVDVEFNGTNIGEYTLYEYSIMYYLSLYENKVKEYNYYNKNEANLKDAVAFFVDNTILDRPYSIVDEYHYDGKVYKQNWTLDNKKINEESYIANWVNFPYFLIKAGERYWSIRDSIKDSTYIDEYENKKNITTLDNIYKTEESILYNEIISVEDHPYVKSDKIKISGNLREDTVNEKLKAQGEIPFDTNLILNVETEEREASKVRVYINGEKYKTYTLEDNKCGVKIEDSKLIDETGSRNVISFILMNDNEVCLTDTNNKIINSYITIVRGEDIEKEKYTVEFKTNGGTNINSIEVEEGERINLPVAPTRLRSSFVGWYNDKKLKEAFDKNEYIINEKILYAKWNGTYVAPSGGSSGGSSGGGGRGGSSVAMSSVMQNASPMGTTVGNVRKGVWNIFNNRWIFTDSTGNRAKDAWVYIESTIEGEKPSWYKFDKDGNMETGLVASKGKVYYLNEGLTNPHEEGKMMTGWQWIKNENGYYEAHYFRESEELNLMGEMLVDTITPDGLRVDKRGRWVVNGIVLQFLVKPQ